MTRAFATFEVSRRRFIKSLGAGILITVAAPALAQESQPRRQRPQNNRPVDISARIHIAADGTVTVMTGKVECGQGARAEITQAAAEELALSPDKVQLIMGDTQLCPDDGGTFGSQTTPRTLPSIRYGCAAARELLLAAACAKWNIDDPAGLELRDGRIRDPISRREVTYADLVGDDSAKLFQGAIPKGVNVTPVKDWQVMGNPVMRPNARDLVTGAHEFPSDIVRDKMLYGVILRPPSYGARLKSLDLDVAGETKGVTAVRDGDFVGVVAATSFAARKALGALAKTAKWTEPSGISVTELYDHLRTTARGIPDNPYAGENAGAAHALKAEYHVAYIQHAPLEPRAAVAEWAGEKLTVWTGSQNPWAVRNDLSRALNLSNDSVRVIIPDFGGGFGGKHSGEAAIEAARLARSVNKPVKVRWSREEEFTWAYFRPAGVILAEAALGANAALSSWYFVNINSGPAALDTPYSVKNKRVQTVGADPVLKPGSYRGLAATANHFARESFMDELAHAAGKDPLDFRLGNLKDERLIAVLKAATDKFGWSAERAKRPNRGIGLACGTEKGSYVAACAEISVDTNAGTITVQKVTQAFECGKIVNPINLMSQVQGAIVMGLGPALREQIRFEKGVITNGSFADYEPPRFGDLPELDIHLLDRPDLPSAGAGETPIVAIAPAIANALFNATGQRVREMPIRLT
ncbi:MAG TPA: molybdopterin cofactor-binding domain-containing protein [Phycisphaerae bacterium]|nr:molybdopterin cofactor-binding domain-containing protein [Phycisphaerae bacterium]